MQVLIKEKSQLIYAGQFINVLFIKRVGDQFANWEEGAIERVFSEEKEEADF